MRTERETPPFGQPRYATRVRYRSPEWKAHTTEGNARRALATHHYGELWEFGEGAWRLIAERNGR